jgi:hypothetical protein
VQLETLMSAEPSPHLLATISRRTASSMRFLPAPGPLPFSFNSRLTPPSI